MTGVKKCVLICVHDDHWFIEKTIDSTMRFGEVFVFVSRLAWGGASAGGWENCEEIARRAGASVITGDWPTETEHRRFAVKYALDREYAFALIPDGDEVPEPVLLDYLRSIADNDLADVAHVQMDTYWKSKRYVIRPRESLCPALLIKLSSVEHVHIREFSGSRHLTLSPSHGLLHHLSYAGPDERIARKISSWSHSHEVIPNWFQTKWKAWDADKLLVDLHPTHPRAYGFVEKQEPPEILQGIWDEYPTSDTVTPDLSKWPTVSVIIPLHGGVTEIRQCLESLKSFQYLIHEIIVVDDVSPDAAATVAAEFEVDLRQNVTVQGFGRSCNLGFEASSGDVVLFLNSDTIVPQSGFVRLIECLVSSGSIGAAGPLSNNVGYYQRLSPTYTGIENLDAFSNDLAHRDAPAEEVDMLVGFALAITRKTLQEVGLFDENFGRGLFEDTDLCYRIQRAGYRLVLCPQSYIHHWGSRTISKAIPDVSQLLAENGVYYRSKWNLDVKLGFVNKLPGFELTKGRLVFDESKRPDRILNKIQKKAQSADISLCMIVKNEARVLENCLKSVQPFFNEIVIVDTGSTDQTLEIARKYATRLVEIEWPDSFSQARNVSLANAKGKWIFWLDADDELPFESGERILEAVLSAPIHVGAFVIPVKFVEEGPHSGTQVDHVKLFRNLPGIEFEGRIHEQILPSLRRHGVELARLNAHVLHAGYDTSETGQQRKRERDWHLLNVELAERPNHPFVWFNVGMTHHYSEEHEEAVSALQNSIQLAGDNDSHLRKAYSMIGASLRALGKMEECESALCNGLAALGNDPEIRFQLGVLYGEIGVYEKAIEHYSAMSTDIGDHFSSIDIGILTHKRDYNLGIAYLKCNDRARSRDCFLDALKGNPNFLPAVFVLFDLALEDRYFDEAMHWIKYVKQYEGPSPNMVQMQLRLIEQTFGSEYKLPILRQLVSWYPDSVACILELSRLLLELNFFSEAQTYLSALSANGVAEAAYLLGVCAIRKGDYRAARTFMDRAHELNPEHELTLNQLDILRRLT